LTDTYSAIGALAEKEYPSALKVMSTINSCINMRINHYYAPIKGAIIGMSASRQCRHAWINRSRVGQLDGIVDRTHEVTAPTYPMPVTSITNDRPVRYECF
jgi:hypothetical protein